MGKLKEAAEKYIVWHDGDNAKGLLKAFGRQCNHRKNVLES